MFLMFSFHFAMLTKIKVFTCLAFVSCTKNWKHFTLITRCIMASFGCKKMIPWKYAWYNISLTNGGEIVNKIYIPRGNHFSRPRPKAEVWEMIPPRDVNFIYDWADRSSMVFSYGILYEWNHKPHLNQLGKMWSLKHRFALNFISICKSFLFPTLKSLCFQAFFVAFVFNFGKACRSCRPISFQLNDVDRLALICRPISEE